MEAGYQPVHLLTDRGKVECRYYAVEGADKGAVWVGGAGGGWDTPAHDLYPRLCEALVAQGIASLRVRFRKPNELAESVLDVLAGLAFLREEGMSAAALAGHSFGGAVVIGAAAADETARTVVTLATQSYGAEPAAQLAPRCSILLAHGMADRVLPPYCSQMIYMIAGEPKRLVLYEKAGHGLEEVAEPLYTLVYDWILEQLTAV